MTSATIAIIGAGHMGASLVGGLIANHYPEDKLWIADPSNTQLIALSNRFSNIHSTNDNLIACSHASIIILAVKPQIFSEVASPLADIVQKNKPLIISIAAGIRATSIEKWLGGNIAIVRAMPNTPSLIGCGATALYANQFVTEEQRNLAESILRAVSVSVWIDDEKLMDVITSLSGSGPAYFFLVIEALQKAAEDLGLPEQTSRLLTLQTAYGASRMALESDIDVTELRRRVTSPGGTTERALQVLENKIHEVFKEALTAATKRSEELAKQFDI